MKTLYYIGPSQITLPIWRTALIAFWLWYFKVDNLWWGVFIAFESIIWIIAGVLIWKRDAIDINTPEGRKKLKNLLDNPEHK